jgi:hypothetical protein
VHEFIREQLLEASVREFGLDVEAIVDVERRGLDPSPDIERILDEHHRLVVAGLQVVEGQAIDDVYQRELSGQMMYSKEAFADFVRRFSDVDSLRKSLDREAVRAAMADASRKMHRRGAISAQLAERFNEAVWTEHKDADSIEAEAVATLVKKLNVEVAAPYSMPTAKDLLAH